MSFFYHKYNGRYDYSTTLRRVSAFWNTLNGCLKGIDTASGERYGERQASYGLSVRSVQSLDVEIEQSRTPSGTILVAIPIIMEPFYFRRPENQIISTCIDTQSPSATIEPHPWVNNPPAFLVSDNCRKHMTPCLNFVLRYLV